MACHMLGSVGDFLNTGLDNIMHDFQESDVSDNVFDSAENYENNDHFPGEIEEDFEMDEDGLLVEEGEYNIQR